MPYVTRICTKCGEKQETYHNAWKCKKCKAEKCLITSERHRNRTIAPLRHENRILRAEVNALRERLGLGIKYREYEGGPATV